MKIKFNFQAKKYFSQQTEDLSIDQALLKVAQKSKNIALTLKCPILTLVRMGSKCIPWTIYSLALSQQMTSLTVEFKFASKYDQLLSQGYRLRQQLMTLSQSIGEIKKFQPANQLSFYRRYSSTSLCQIQFTLQVQISLLLSEPLVLSKPIFKREINVKQHVDRLQMQIKKNRSINITLYQHCAYPFILNSILQFKDNISKARIVQLHADVIVRDDEMYLCLQSAKHMGKSDLRKPQEVFANANADLLIIIGIRAALLSSYPFCIPTLLLSTHSLEKDETDDSARLFIDTFYSNLFDRKGIKQSYDLAIDKFKNTVYENWYCCCLHQHSKQCSWNRLFETIGPSLSHKLFTHCQLRRSQNTQRNEIREKVQSFLANQLLSLQNYNNCYLGKETTCCESFKHKQNKTKRIVLIEPAIGNDFYKGSIDKYKQNTLSRKNTRLEAMTRTYPHSLSCLIYDIFSINQQIIIVKKTKGSQHQEYSTDLLREAVSYISERDTQIQFSMVQEKGWKEFIRENAQKGKQYSFKQKIKRWYIIINMELTVFSYQNIKEQLQKLQDSPFIVLIHTFNIPIKENNIIKLQEKDNLQEIIKFLTQIKKQQFNDYKKVSEKIIKCIKPFQDNTLKEKYALFQRQQPQEYNLLLFICQFPNGFFKSSFNDILLRKYFKLKQISKKSLSQDFFDFQQKENNLIIKTTKQVPYSSTSKLSVAAYTYFVLKLHWMVSNHITHLDSFVQSQHIGKGVIFSLQMENQSDRQLLEQTANQCLQSQEYFSMEQKSQFHQKLLQKILCETFHLIDDEYYWKCAIYGYLISISNHKFFIYFNQIFKHLKAFAFKIATEIKSSLLKLQLNILLQIKSNHQSIHTIVLMLQKYENYKIGQCYENDFVKNFKKWQELYYQLKKIFQEKQFNNYKIQQNQLNLFRKIKWDRQRVFIKCLKTLCLFQGQQFNNSQQVRKNIIQELEQYIQEINNQQNNLFLSRQQSLPSQHIQLVKKQSFFQQPLLLKRRISNQVKKDIVHAKICLAYLKEQLGEQIQTEIMQANDYQSIFHPLYSYLRGKKQKSFLFQQSNLIIFARAKTFPSNDTPTNPTEVFVRKRSLMTRYTTQLLKQKDVKIAYLNLNEQRLKDIKVTIGSPRCKFLCLIASIDCIQQQKKYYILLQQNNHINSQKHPLKQFVETLSLTNIQLLIIIGENSKVVANELRWKSKSVVMYIQSNKSKFQHSLITRYLINEASECFVDLFVVSLIYNVYISQNNRREVHEYQMKEIINKCIEVVNSKLKLSFSATVMKEMSIEIDVYMDTVVKFTLPGNGQMKDLTMSLYSCPKLLIDEPFYQNIGRVRHIRSIMDSVLSKLQRSSTQRISLELKGVPSMGRSALLQEASWLFQVKNLFPQGVFKIRLKQIRGNTSIVQYVAKYKISLDGMDGQSVDKKIFVLDDLEVEDIERNKEFFQKITHCALLYSTSSNQVNDRLREFRSNIDSVHLEQLRESQALAIAMSFFKHEKNTLNQQEYEKRLQKLHKKLKDKQFKGSLLFLVKQWLKKNLQIQDFSPNKFLQFYQKNFISLLQTCDKCVLQLQIVLK